jgi:Family of unknown function (DUF5681)
MTHSQSVEKVGYKNPPRATRWTKGQTGNPSRKRKKHTVSIAGIINKYFAKEIDITMNGACSRASIFEVIIMQLWAKTVTGDKRAMTVLLSYLEFSTADRRREIIIINKYNEATKKMMAELGIQDEGPIVL